MRPSDKRRVLVPAAILVAAAVGFLIDQIASTSPGLPAEQAAEVPNDARALPAEESALLAHMRFQQAVVMLHGGEHRNAAVALEEVLRIHPNLPEAHANMGYALLGLGAYDDAAAYFQRATDLNPSLHTGYYGLALAESNRGNTTSALAAMQAFAHLAAADDPWLDRAQTSMRAWESELDAASRSPRNASESSP